MDSNTFGSLLLIIMMFLTLGLIVLYSFSLVWVYRDSEARGKTGTMWVLIAFFTWPFGVLAYYLLREKEVTL